MILRPVTEDDLKLLERLLTEPGATGDQWHGWQDTRWLRRRWDENGLLGKDRGILMAACEDNAIGFVSWGETWRDPAGPALWHIATGKVPARSPRQAGR